MNFFRFHSAATALFFGLMAWVQPTHAEAVSSDPVVIKALPKVSLIDRAADTAQTVLDQAMQLLGAPYRWGGDGSDTRALGFDCSGFVTHVFSTSLGLTLPRTARAMSQIGEKITTQDLQPGDLVFFNTMRRAFSHVGIYLGNDRFIHAPRSGEGIRIDNLYDSYWLRRFNGARRIDAE